MTTINASIQMTQNMSAAMQSIHGSTNSAISSFASLQSAISQANIQMEIAVDKQEDFQKETAGSIKGMTLLKNAMSGLGVSLDIQKVLQLSDAMAQTKARLSLMNKDESSTGELQSKIFDSANRSGNSYANTANAVTDLGLNAGDSFQSNDAVIAFVEQVNKQLALGGTAADQQSNAMAQLSQAMAGGVLQGEALNTVLDAAPGIGRSIEESMGWAEGSIRSYAEQGAVTSQVVRDSMFAMQGATNAAFNDMGMTWQQVGNVMSNKLLQMSTPLLAFINTLAKNWSILEPIVVGVLGALALYKGAVLASAAATAFASFHTALLNILTGGTSLRVALANWALKKQAVATTEAAVAQWGLNAALLASPLTWIVGILLVVIVTLYAVVAWINKTKDTTISATGLIVGAFFALGAIIYNIIVGVINAIMQIAWTRFAEPWIGIIEWVLNVFNGGFNSFGDAVKNLLGNIISWFLSLGKVATKIIDAIFGTNWTEGLNALQDKVLKWGKNDKAITLNRTAPTINSRLGVKNSFNTGYGMGENGGDVLKGMFDPRALDNFNPNGEETAANVAGIAGNTGSMADSMSVSEEDMTYLRDIAEREAINRFTTAEIKVEMANSFGDVRETADVDGIISYLAYKIEEQMAVSAEGVYI
ncbi:tape measure protein [Aminipila butyrica]|uniref:Tape measure protein n=1 Tax=Aminipila butyrica TaxID=433296 RepID=A0A858BRS5_9FIRM|nr:tape measure protein [Aminipila butyrica]QIB68641.1 tape measure protein [Aminipila butyrica]